jgi:hypothetical protein
MVLPDIAVSANSDERKNVSDEIKEALRHSTLAYVQNGMTGCIDLCRTDEWDLARSICEMQDAASRVARSSGKLFKVKFDASRNERIIGRTKLGQTILQLLKRDTGGIRQVFPQHTLNLYTELFLKAAETRGLDRVQWGFETMLVDTAADNLVKRLNEFVDDIRAQAGNGKFRVAASKFTRLANKNCLSLRKYFCAQFEAQKRLHVLRLDFGYVKEAYWPYSLGEGRAYDEVKGHREQLIRFMRKKLPSGCVTGFAWKMEHSRIRDWNIHVLIFLTCDDDRISEMLGEQWNTWITKGTGLYSDCSRSPCSYKKFGTGVIDADDCVAQDGLRVAAIYLTKTDCQIQLAVPGKDYVFRKGNMPKPKHASAQNGKIPDPRLGNEVGLAERKRLASRPRMPAAAKKGDGFGAAAF